MALPPFTHHEMLALAGPFGRAGCQADLAASDRAARRLAFRPVVHAAAGGLPAMTETLMLESEAPNLLSLTRTLQPEAGPAATLVAEGVDAAALLAAVRAVPPARQFRVAAGSVTALHHAVRDDGTLALRRAEARVGGLTLNLTVSGVSGFPAELELLRGERGPRELPRDLLAVLGRRWDRLTTVSRGWLGALQVKGSGAARTADAEAGLAQTVDHLALTLAEPPARFHERHLGARWRVAMRGTLPVAVGLTLVGIAFSLRGRTDSQAITIIALLANISPPLLMGLFFMRREMPQIGLPRPPRRPRPDAWGA